MKKRKIAYRPLTIGGIGTTDEKIHINFIDRRKYHSKLFQEAIEQTLKQRHTIKIGTITLPLVPVEYLIALKMVSGEPKDDNDVKRLLKYAELDYKKSRDIVMKHLGPATADRLDVFARQVGRLKVPKRKYYE